jgi:hypothetical protein
LLLNAFRIGTYEIGTPKYSNPDFVGSVCQGEQNGLATSERFSS